MQTRAGGTLIRALDRADADELYRLYTNSDVHRFTTPFWKLWGREDFQRWVGPAPTNGDFRFAVCESAESSESSGIGPNLIGFVELNRVNWLHGTAEVGIALFPSEYRGRGHGTAAIVLISRWAFLTLRLRRLYAKTFSSNVASRRSFEKAGFVQEGVWRKHFFVNGALEDAVLYGLLHDDKGPSR